MNRVGGGEQLRLQDGSECTLLTSEQISQWRDDKGGDPILGLGWSNYTGYTGRKIDFRGSALVYGVSVPDENDAWAMAIHASRALKSIIKCNTRNTLQENHWQPMSAALQPVQTRRVHPCRGGAASRPAMMVSIIASAAVARSNAVGCVNHSWVIPRKNACSA